jgi:phospho-N-acetylmuramoyl-pentapeptide-transferase
MERVLGAAILSMAISILAGPKLIAFLRAREYGQYIREEGPADHAVKQGTPTMGGLLFLLSAAIPFLVLSRYTAEGLTVFFVTLGCALVGFIDDYIKVTHRRSLGLAGRWKLLLLAGITAGVAWVVQDQKIPKAVYVPVIDWRVGLSLAFFVLLFLIIAGAANGANLTDGIDGLAVGVGIIALFTFTAISMLAYFREGQLEDAAQRVAREPAQDLAIWGAALIGGMIGFLWFNAFPAEVMMGDTGSMAIGGALAGFAVMTRAELLLVLAGGIFVIEALSVILQVFSFKYSGRRLFLMAPIHHHFAMKAWSETKIMVRFWIVAGILCAVAFALYYQYYFEGFRDLR